MKTELELRHLRTFLAVVQSGSHTRAARSLGISQSTVSETLSALERALGVEIFRKSSKGIELTPFGTALVPYAKQFAKLRDELLGDLTKISGEVRSKLTIAAVESISSYVLPLRLTALRQRWPNCRIEVISAMCADIRECVANGRADVGLTLETEGDAADEEPYLARSHLVIFAHPSHPLARKRASAEQLREWEFQLSDIGGSYHQALRRHFEAEQTTPPSMQVLGNIEGVKRGILAGTLALGLVPSHAIRQELRDGTLAEVGTLQPLPGLVLRAVCSDAPHSPMMDALLDDLRDATQFQ